MPVDWPNFMTQVNTLSSWKGVFFLSICGQTQKFLYGASGFHFHTRITNIFTLVDFLWLVMGSCKMCIPSEFLFGQTWTFLNGATCSGFYFHTRISNISSLVDFLCLVMGSWRAWSTSELQGSYWLGQLMQVLQEWHQATIFLAWWHIKGQENYTIIVLVVLIGNSYSSST